MSVRRREASHFDQLGIRPLAVINYQPFDLPERTVANQMNLVPLLLTVAAAAIALTDTAKPTTIVLVHGAFADASSWAKVIPMLEGNGYSVTAVQIPLTSLDDDVATTKRVIEAQK